MARTKAHQKYIHQDTGKPVPGATTIIGDSLGWNKGALMGWARKTAMAGDDPNKVRDKAASIGTLAHALIEEYLGDTYPSIKKNPVDRSEYPPEDLELAENAFIAYLDWEKLHDVEPLEAEIQLVHPFLLYGGTIDMVAMVDGVLTMVDFKTSKGIYNDHVIQAAAYQTLMIACEYGGVEDLYPPVVILHVNKENGRMTEHRFKPEELIEPWQVFHFCLGIRNLKKRMPFR